MKFNDIKNTDISSFNEFELIPKGTYDLMITRAEEKVANTSKKPYILIGFRIMNDDSEKSYKGRYVWTNLNASEVGIKILKSILVYNHSPLAELDGSVEIDPASLIGMKVRGTVGTEKDMNGDLRNKVGFFKEVSEEFANTDESYFSDNSSSGTGPANLAPAVSTGTEDLPF